MDNHEQYQELISRLLDEDNALTPEENAALQAHLEACAECRAMYEAFSSLSAFVGGELEEPPEELRANVMAEIRREEIRRKNSRVFSWTGFVAAAAVLALVVGFAPRILAGSSMDSGAVAAQAAAGAVYAAEAVPAENGSTRSSAVKNASEEIYITMDSASAAAAESAPAEETQQSAYPDEFLPEGEEETLDPYFEESAEEKLSLDDLLFFLGGIETELDPAERNLSPFFLIDTDGGVLEIYRYNNSLYFYDPHTGIPCEASCSESALVRYLQN